jgi:oxygen-independent coproporphyrinogen III oxidase
MSSDAFDVTVDLLRKYDRHGPRYTSYPTAVEFHPRFDATAYRAHLAEAASNPGHPLSLYVHLPFCEERCTFCGCMVVITKKRDVAATYLEYLKREIAMLGAALSGRRRVVQYHWGGGTPTYLSPAQMADLHEAVATHFDIDPDGEAAIEVDPRVTTFEQLDLLRRLGFNRLSMGVQDFTPAVQAAVNRVQPVEMTRALFDHARGLGFASINVDLIYGLPLQTRASFATTVDTVLAMRPDRVAVYSMALVPWLRAHQKRLPMADLPGPEAKLELFVEALRRFVAAGYRQIGMDHFALPDDELAKASEAGRLHRNFMGYTTRPAPDMVGVGVSSIGDVSGAFAQNVKPLAAYYDALDAGRFPIERGHRLDRDDHVRRFVITELMCNFRVRQADLCERFGVAFPLYFALEIDELLRGPVADGFLRITSDGLEVTANGRLFVRNIAMHFDRYLRHTTSAAPAFSKTI